MAQYGSSDQTVQVTTGNVRTTMDKFDATQLNNAARNTLGSVYVDNAVTAANPNGAPTKYRYVRYNSAANSVALQANPAAVYWTDNTFTVVTGKISEAWTANASSFAGLLMPNTTDFVGLTAALLNGNFIWIAVSGLVKAVVSAAAAAGDQMMATVDMSTTGGLTKVAAGVAPTNRVAGYAAAASPSDVWVFAESL